MVDWSGLVKSTRVTWAPKESGVEPRPGVNVEIIQT